MIFCVPLRTCTTGSHGRHFAATFARLAYCLTLFLLPICSPLSSSFYIFNAYASAASTLLPLLFFSSPFPNFLILLFVFLRTFGCFHQHISAWERLEFVS